MPDDFLVARNPEENSSLPFLIRIPLGERGIVLKAREAWPRTAKVYCHRADAWPDEPDVVERVGTRSCQKRGAAIDLVLDRGRENRSQFVLTYVRGREAIFWQTSRTTKQARPHASAPTGRAQGRPDLEILVDAHERYAWKFSDLPVTTRTKALAAGDYGVEVDGRLVASVERKSLADLISTLSSGRMRYVLADLSSLPRAALVVEDRYSKIFADAHVRPSVIADAVAECQARFPSVPVIFAENRAFAQQWAYRFLAAALTEIEADAPAASRLAELPTAPLPPRAPTTAEIRAWALAEGLPVSDRGRLRPDVLAAYAAAHPTEP
ncbi:ERCC4 domain-containing protein [Propioniciclava soli]|uniref:ERCC4 domain-containing protein n=1 Tax=Propioniciclava soli TaxID=2775081 RepID=UPI001E45838D|nr:ERCC4 domain-containing protein [Propioniciclava soli]